MDDKKRQTSGSTGVSTVTTVAGTGTAQDAELICTCHEPKLEKIEVEEVLGAEMAQKVVEFDMIVPDRKPDIEQVIDVYVKNVEIDSVDVIPNKVIIRGNFEVKVMYVAALPDQPVHAFEKRHIRFTRDIEIDGADKDMKATADVTVEFVDYEFEEEEPRKVHITVVLKFWARVITTTEIDVYALTPIDQIGEVENLTASASNADIASAGVLGGTAVSASQTGGGEIVAVSPQNILVTGVQPTAGTKVTVQGMAVVKGSVVNVRTGPGTNFPVVVKVKKGDKVTIKDQAFGWYKVVLSDGTTTGWIASWLVEVNTVNVKG